MHQDDRGLEQRLSRFEAQLDRFSLALHQWQTHDHTPSGSDIDHRIRALEETLDREAHALRSMHEEPLRQLQSHAARLQELCANVQMVLAELQARGGLPVPATPKPAAWPLERVVHLHDQLRRDGSASDHVPAEAGHHTPALTSGQHAHDGVSSDSANGRRQRSFIEADRTTVQDEDRQRRRYIAAGATIVVAVVAIAGIGLWVASRLNDAAGRVTSAEQQVAATTRLANDEVRAARDDANRQIAEARQLAQRAETVSAVLTAPDLIRFNLTSTLADGSSAQVLWSRSRGVVLSGSRLPGPGPEKTYQLWLVTNGPSVSAGVFAPDSTGRATLVVDPPPKVTGPVMGAAITIEPEGGRQAPTGQMLLTRFPPPTVAN
jgi:anti-sigma-K factor RskA